MWCTYSFQWRKIGQSFYFICVVIKRIKRGMTWKERGQSPRALRIIQQTSKHNGKSGFHREPNVAVDNYEWWICISNKIISFHFAIPTLFAFFIVSSTSHFMKKKYFSLCFILFHFRNVVYTSLWSYRYSFVFLIHFQRSFTFLFFHFLLR